MVRVGRGWQRTDKGKKKIRIEDIVQDAAEKFGKSDVTIRRAWQRFGPLDWLNDKAGEHGIQGPIIVTGWSASDLVHS